MSGSGKSSLTIISLICQLLGFPIFVIDLGGDQNLYHNIKRAAEAIGLTFRYLTLDTKLASFNFPPFQTLTGLKLQTPEVSQRLLRAFNLDFGAAIYGATYYASRSLDAMLSIAKHVFAANPNAELTDVDRHLNRPENKQALRDAESIRMNVRFCLQYPQLSAASDPEQNILIERAIEQSEVTYFFCPSLDDPIVSPLVGGMALATIIHIASERAKAGKPRVPIYVVVDEFSEIVGRSLGALLAQGRKYGLRFILANQSTSQLEPQGGFKLSDTVFEGTTFKQYFTSLGDDIKVLQSLSRDKRIQLGGSTVQGLSTSVSFKDQIVPSLDRDDILKVSATFGQSFVVLNDGKGHRDPVVVQQTHEYPDLSEEPMKVRGDSLGQYLQVPQPPTVQTAARDAGYDRRQKLITELLAKKMAEEHWELQKA
jgi:hypothetical protein